MDGNEENIEISVKEKRTICWDPLKQKFFGVIRQILNVD